MTLTVPIGVIGFVLSVVPAWPRTLAPKSTFARRLLEDHGGAQSALQAAAEGSSAAVPTTLDQDHQTRLTALRGKSGWDFDEAYVADRGEVHSNALTRYGDYMLWGETQKLHALAMKMIPITEAQLKDAQALAGD
jgi:putative membrane protein